MRISHLFILLAASAMLTACDFLDEYNPNSVTVGNYYTSEEDIVASLNGVYTSLTQSYVADNYHYFTDVRANATVVTNSGANSGIPYQFYNYTLTEENVYVYNRYSQLYKIISRANTLFAHLGDVSYATPSARDTYEAEARFLRALSYYWLVTEWGDVPLVLKVLESTEEVRANNYRRPKAEIYQAIFDDLKYVTESPLLEICASSANSRRFPIPPSGTSLRRSRVRKIFSRSTIFRGTPTWDRCGIICTVLRERASPRREKARCRTSRYRLSMIHSSRAMSAALSCGQRTRRGRLTITP